LFFKKERAVRPVDDKSTIDGYRLDLFNAKIIPAQPPCDCLLWRGAFADGGYGVFWNGARLEKAHRFALRASGVEIPKDKVVCHSCDTPACVNPKHLYVSTQQGNVRDMWAKGRAGLTRGAARVNSKLDDTKVLRARELCALGATHKEVAVLFGVSSTTIGKMLRGETWRAPSGLIQNGRGR
jgi:hypothetical protein